MTAKERLIVALDVDTKERALALVSRLQNEVSFFKIGLELFSSCGPAIVDEVRRAGCEIFLDLKFHDIPTTVARASAAVTKLGARLFNVHALGGFDMMRKTAEAVAAEAKRLAVPRPKVIAVTVLTSMDAAALARIGIPGTVPDAVVRLALLAKDAGLDGVVASPQEARLIREAAGKEFLIVTPGVRPSWAATDDQKRVATPREAIDDGATHIVVGRPVTGAPDPADAARAIVKEMTP